MSSDLDKFVLQYTVELKDSISRLEKLNQKVDDVKSKSSKAKAELKEFAKGAGDEIGKLVPGVNAVTSAVSSMGKSFGVAAAAVGALGIGVAALMKMRDQYNKQRLVGQEAGVSGLRIEEYQRKLQKNGAGYVTREQTADAIRSITSKASAAYADPTRMGGDAKLFNLLGIDVGALGKGSRSGNAIVTDVAKKFASGTEAQAQAWGAQFGLSPDIAKAMRKAGSSMGSMTEMSNTEVQSRVKAQQELDRFNDATAKLSEQFTRLSNVVAEKLLPAVTRIVEFFTSDKKETPEETQRRNSAGSVGRGLAQASRNRWANDPLYRDPDDEQREQREKKLKEEEEKKAKEKAKLEKETAEKNQKAADEAAEAADREARDGKNSQDEFQLAINMFSGAVSAFSNAVDERQAMAAWAGEIGKAAGLLPPGAGAPNGQGVTAYTQKSQYDPLFEAAAKKHGVPVDLLKRITKVESDFNPGLTSGAGAQGLMQLMPANSKAFGIKNPFDPEENINGGARLLADYMKRSGGDVRRALMMYHGGLKESGWGPLTAAYPDKVLGAGGVSAQGESKSNIRLRQTYENIAKNLGVDPKQLRLGGVNKGDVTWQANQMEAGLQNKIFDLRRQLQTANLPKTEYDRIKREINDQSIALTTLKENRGAVEDKAREGGRSITIGAIPITVNFGGQANANQNDIANAVKQGVVDGVNQAASGNKL